MGAGGYKGKAWPQAMIDNLIRLHQEGFSIGKVAEIMRLSRNTIIGKAWRIGLSFTRETKPWPKPKPKPKPVQLSPEQIEAIAAVRRQRIEKAMRERQERRLTIKQFATKPGNVQLDALTWDSGIPTCCRAIVDGAGSDAVYCGQPVYKRSYCANHFKMFYYSLGQRSQQATSNLR